nr:immunoglobulin heavy chain junction region [Macaca mulatta]
CASSTLTITVPEVW